MTWALVWGFLLKNWKYALLCAAGMVIFVLWQRDRAAMYDKGWAAGGQKIQDQLEKAYKDKWTVALKGINAEKAEIEEAQRGAENKARINEARAKELDASRRAIEAAARNLGEMARSKIEASYTAGKMLGVDSADAALRDISSKLELDRQRREANTPRPVVIPK
jgi:hypothetical protein